MTATYRTCGCLFRFQYRSKDVSPGMGSGESLCFDHKHNMSVYKDMPIKWRTKLSNMYESPFVHCNITWKSVEHLYQCSKYAISKYADDENRLSSAYINEGFADIDSFEEKSLGSKKNLHLTVNQLNLWNEYKNIIMQGILYEKFTQVQEVKDALLSTGTATLSHVSRGVSGDAYNLGSMLEKVRHDLSET